jgi:hypothetical protein
MKFEDDTLRNKEVIKKKTLFFMKILSSREAILIIL